MATFSQIQVDMRKVNLQVIRPWVFKKITELNGIEDELVGEYCMGLLEDESQPVRPLCTSTLTLATDIDPTADSRPQAHDNQLAGLPQQKHQRVHGRALEVAP